MVSSFVRKPTLEIKNQQGQVVPDQGVTNSDTLTAKLTDDDSGPGRLEVWRGAPDAGGTRVFFDDEDFDAVEHTYSLSSLGGDGQYVVRGFDRGGGFVAQRFPTWDPYSVVDGLA